MQEKIIITILVVIIALLIKWIHYLTEEGRHDEEMTVSWWADDCFNVVRYRTRDGAVDILSIEKKIMKVNVWGLWVPTENMMDFHNVGKGKMCYKKEDSCENLNQKEDP